MAKADQPPVVNAGVVCCHLPVGLGLEHDLWRLGADRDAVLDGDARQADPRLVAGSDETG